MNTVVQDPNNPQKKMGITLEVSTESFEKLIKDQLNLLSDEDKKEILKQCLLKSINALIKDDKLELLTARDGYYERYHLSSFGERLINDIDVTNKITEFKNKVMDYLIEHHEEVVERAVLNSLCNTVLYNSTFSDAITGTVHRVLNDMRNNQ